MKNIILLSLLIISVVCGKSIEEFQSEWQQKFIAKNQEQSKKFYQNEEARRVAPHCNNDDKGACKRLIYLNDKNCKNGLA